MLAATGAPVVCACVIPAMGIGVLSPWGDPEPGLV